MKTMNDIHISAGFGVRAGAWKERKTLRPREVGRGEGFVTGSAVRWCTPAQKLRTLMRLGRCFYKRQAKLRSSFAQIGEIPFPGPLFIVLRAEIAKRGAMREEVVDDARDLVGGRDDGGFGAEASPHPPVVGPPAMVAATDGLRREPQGLAGAIAGLERAPAQHFLPRDLMVGGQAEPGAEGPGVGPLPGVQADVGEDGLRRTGIQAGNGDQIHPQQLMQQAAGVIIGGIFLWVRCLLSRFRGGSSSRHTGLIA
jgi:hypothetical protein